MNHVTTREAYDFSQYDILPIPIEIFAPDGLSIYVNRASMEMCNAKDATLLVGIYNYRTDPVCREIMGDDFLDSVFRGEAVSFPDFPAPIQDLKDRGVIDEKPWESAIMDVSFAPKWEGGKFLYTICTFIVKHTYQGRAEIAKAQEYIEQHWLEVFDIDKIAKSVNLSVRHFNRLYKSHMGINPHDSYKSIKIEKLKEKLRDPNLNVTQAFAECGVDSKGAFFRMFKEDMKMTPSKYREQNIKK